MASCKYCGKAITWMKEGRKNVPVEDDGGVHECAEYKKSKNSYREVDLNSIDPEILKQYQTNLNNSKSSKNSKKK